jgi:uncharacterized protein YkwD
MEWIKINPTKPHKMKSLPHKFYAIILFSFILFSCSNDEDGIYFEESNSVEKIEKNVTYSAIESEILILVNEYRESKGLPSLEPLNVISGVADGHTNYMIETGDVGHANFAQRSQFLMENAQAKSVGENVAYGFGTAKGVMNGWLNSEGHRENIENINYTHFGISTESNSEGRNYFTQIFIAK